MHFVALCTVVVGSAAAHTNASRAHEHEKRQNMKKQIGALHNGPWHHYTTRFFATIDRTARRTAARVPFSSGTRSSPSPHSTRCTYNSGRTILCEWFLDFVPPSSCGWKIRAFLCKTPTSPSPSFERRAAHVVPFHHNAIKLTINRYDIVRSEVRVSCVFFYRIPPGTTHMSLPPSIPWSWVRWPISCQP